MDVSAVAPIPTIPLVGLQRPKYLDSPAVGAEWSYRVDGNRQLVMTSVIFTLATSAVVANRFPHIQYADGDGRVFADVVPVAAQAAGATVTYYAAPDFTLQDVVDSTVQMRIPRIVLPPNWIIQTSTSAMDAGDQYSAIRLVYVSYSTAAAGYNRGELAGQALEVEIA